MVMIILIAVVVLLLLYVIVTYNGLVRLRNRAENAWAQVDVQLRKRYDLIPNLVETVKGYAAHERGTFEAVTQARTAAQQAQGVHQQAEAENMCCTDLCQSRPGWSTINVIASGNVPQLKVSARTRLTRSSRGSTLVRGGRGVRRRPGRAGWPGHRLR